MKKTLFKRGFTLIELLVVIAIIGILTAIISANLLTAKAKARDGKRISDINQIQLALELGFDKCSSYPPNITDTSATFPNCGGVTLASFISTIPKDPMNTGLYVYTYAVSGLDYVLRANLENNNSVLVDDVDGTVSIGNTVCDDNVAPFYYCLQPK